MKRAAIVILILALPAVISAAPVWTDADNALLSEFLSEADPVKRRALIEKHRARLTEAWQDAALERARALASEGQPDLGIRITERVEEIARATIGEQQAAWATFQRGQIHFYNRNDNAAARAAYETARAIYRKVGDVQGEANCIKSLGDIAFRTSDNEGARRRYEEALPLYRKVGSVLGEANCIRSLGDVALYTSDNEGARRRYEEALPLFRKVGDVLGEANCIYRLGDIALRTSDNEGARRRYEEATALYRKVGDVLGEANCIFSLGDLALRTSDNEGARRRYEEALPLFRKVGDVLGEANCIRRLGDIAFRTSDNEGARRRYEEALPLYRKVGDVLGEANCIFSLGDIALRTSDNEGARRRYAEAAGRYASIDDRYSLYNAARNLARALLRLHRLPEARAALDRALSAALYTRAQAGAGSDRLRYQEGIGASMKYAVFEFAGRDPVFALSIWERFRGRSFLEGLSGRQALEAAGVSEADRNRWQQLQAAEASARHILAGIARGGAGDLAAARTRVERTERALEAFESELAKKHPRFAELRRPTIPEVPDLQKSLGADEAALVFLLSDVGAGLWVVKQKSLRFQALEGTSTQVTDRIAGLRRHIEREGQTRGVAVKVHSTVSDTREGFSLLGAQLFGQLGADLKGVGRVLIVPDGSLGVLPFAGVLVNGKSLAEQYRLSFAPSLATAAKLRARDYASRRRVPLVAFGGAYYSAASGAAESKPQDPAAREAALAVILRRGYREGSWTDLPGARAEARAVGALYYRRESERRAGLFEGIHASEPALKSFNRGRGRVSLGKARVLHFALHGKAEADFPETSRIILSQPGVIPEKERAELRRAYPDFPHEDGSLLAAEIVGLRLHADLVVLSACETGLGKATSTEGVVGLTQAWMIAGANGVVVSLWEVSDLATRIFMTEFHIRVSKGVPPAVALDEAQRALQNGTWRRGEFASEKEIGDGSGRRFRELDLSSAYYWAAFQYWGK